jgi:2-keto-3-deoxy-L-rhamnonate aldolase RhmA
MKKKTDAPRSWKNPLFVRSTAADSVAESLLLGEKLRRKTSSGWALGTFLIELPTASAVTAIALAGFDFVVLDMEHSAIDFATLEPLIHAAHVAALPALVRPWGEDIGLIGKILDMGAAGIMAPHVDTTERAQAIVEQARFAPRGHRGFSPLTKFDALQKPLWALNDSTYVVVQIEGRSALEQVDKIASVPGIDAVFVGPYDLALSLQVPPGSPPVLAAAERIGRRVARSVALGIYIDDPGKCGAWAARRFSLQCVSFDGRMLSNGARAIVDQARRGVSKRRANNQ